MRRKFTGPQEIRVGDGYKKGGSNWRVTDTTAGIITIMDGHGNTRIVAPSQLNGLKRLPQTRRLT